MPALGVVFAILVSVAFFVGTDLPIRDASDEAWIAYYQDSGNRREQGISFILVGLAAVCFLLFLGSLRGALARAESEPARMTTGAVGAGVVFITILLFANVVGTAVSLAVTFYGSNFTVDADTARLFAGVAWGLWVMSLFAVAAMALATATVALRMRAFPRWLGWLSVLAAIAGVLGILELPALVVLAWLVALSLYLVWPRPTARPTASA